MLRASPVVGTASARARRVGKRGPPARGSYTVWAEEGREGGWEVGASTPREPQVSS